MEDGSDKMKPRNKLEVPYRPKKNAKCVRINRWRKSLRAIFADDIRRDRRIKSLSVSPA